MNRFWKGFILISGIMFLCSMDGTMSINPLLGLALAFLGAGITASKS